MYCNEFLILRYDVINMKTHTSYHLKLTYLLSSEMTWVFTHLVMNQIRAS